MRHDLGFALRRIRRRPLHSALVALTLGLGIGASLAIFAAVDAVLLRPLPYPGADRLVGISQSIPSLGGLRLSYSDVAFRRVAQGHTLAAASAWNTHDVNLVNSASVRRLIVAQVSGTIFDVLRVSPALGRPFVPDEDVPTGPRVLVLSDWLWRSAFNADPDVIGRVASLEGEPYSIVGVLPASVSFPSREVAAWEPLRLDTAAVNPYQNRYSVIARLQPAATLGEARTELTQLVRAVGREYPGPHPGSALDPAGNLAEVRPLSDELVGDARPVVTLLLAGVLLLLLLTCANVANLQLAAMIGRSGELAVLTAMGASRARLVLSAVLEGVILAGAGALLGLVVAVVGTGALASLMPEGVALSGRLLGGRLLTIVVLAVLTIGAVIGALPVAVVAGRDAGLGIRNRLATGSPGAHRLRRGLAAAQVALAVLLVHGSGLLIASAQAVQQIRLGFRPDSTISLRFNLPDATLRNRPAREALLRRLVSEVGQLPGVSAAGLVNALPLTPGRRDLAMAVEGRPFKADGTDPLADYRVVSQGYFAAMGIPLLQGRLFTDDDASERFTPILVSEGLARQLFPDGRDPVGQRIRFGPAAPWMPIVGVVGNARNRSLTDPPRPELYAPGLGTWANLSFATEITLVARSRGDAMALAAPIRRIIADAAPDAATYNLASLGEIVREARSRMNTATTLMSGYAVAALLLAMAGTYAVLSYLVSQRRRELAVRMALGATPWSIVALVVRESARLLAFGIVAGLAGALALARLLAGLLYGVGALDGAVLLLVILSAVAAGTIAAIVPARRAARVDPATALNSGQ